MDGFNSLKLNGIIAESGTSQNDAAKLIGVHYNTISAWVNGRAEPRPKQLIRLLKKLGCDVDTIRLVDFWQVPDCNGSEL